MKKIRYFMLLSAVFAVCTIITSCSKNNEPTEPEDDGSKQEVMSDRNDIEKPLTPTVYAPPSSYMMRLENTALTLYEITGGEETAVTTVNIDPSNYPTEDIKELNRGIIAYSKEDGFAKMENYAN